MIRRAPCPKRFYKEAVAAPAEGGYGIFLDGRPVNTPARRPLAAPSQPLAEAIAAEWAKQGETIDPATMPLTKLMNAALDGVTAQMAEVEARSSNMPPPTSSATAPASRRAWLAAQSSAWDPLVAFAREKLAPSSRSPKASCSSTTAAGGARRFRARRARLCRRGRRVGRRFLGFLALDVMTCSSYPGSLRSLARFARRARH